MWPLSLAFVDIALHRRGPADLPASQFLFGLVIVAYVIVTLVGLAVISATRTDLLLTVIETLVDLGVVFLVLKLFEKTRRFLQTAIALFGTAVVLSLIGIPLLQWDQLLQAPPTELNAPRLLYLVLFIWSLDVAGFILAKALAKPYIVGVSIMVVYELSSMSLREALFPVAA